MIAEEFMGIGSPNLVPAQAQAQAEVQRPKPGAPKPKPEPQPEHEPRPKLMVPEEPGVSGGPRA